MIKIIEFFIAYFFRLLSFLMFLQILLFICFFSAGNEQSNEKTDAIVVFTGGHNRIATALDLFQKEMAPKLYISGLHPKTSINQILKKLNVKDVDTQSIFFDFAKNTEENAAETARWIKSFNIKSITLVTSCLHMKRSHILLSAELKGVKIVLKPVENEECKNVPVDIFSYIEEFLKLEYTFFMQMKKK